MHTLGIRNWQMLGFADLISRLIAAGVVNSDICKNGILSKWPPDIDTTVTTRTLRLQHHMVANWF